MMRLLGAIFRRGRADGRPLDWLHQLFGDLRYGARALRRAPGLTITAVLSLALGIGANTAVFTTVKAMLLSPLPYDQPERIVAVLERNTENGFWSWTSAATFLDWREQNEVFDGLAAIHWSWPANIAGAGKPVRAGGQRVSEDFFEVLGAQAALGRTFLPEDHRAGVAKTVVLSHALWQDLFGGDPDVVGRGITLDNNPCTILGVMPADFRAFHPDVQFWAPFRDELRGGKGNRTFGWLFAIARISEDVSLDEARTQMGVVAGRIAKEFPDTHGDKDIALVPLKELLLPGTLKAALWILFGLVGFVLLVACANVANLLLGRATTRRKEIAVRAALGAGRARLVRQLLAESGLLAFTGAALGIAVAYGVLRWLTAGIAVGLLPRFADLRIDSGVLIFTTVVGVLTGLLFGLVPALRATSLHLADAVSEGTRTTSGSSPKRVRQGLVVLQTALAMIILVGAGLMINTLVRMSTVDFGVESNGLVMMQTLLPRFQYAETAEVPGVKRDVRAIKPEHTAFHRHMVHQLENHPGIEAAGVTDVMPIMPAGHWIRGRNLGTAKQPFDPTREDPPRAIYRPVSPGYFDAMGLALSRGRSFDRRDTEESSWVAIVSEKMARTHWPDEDPIGQFLTFHDYGDRTEPERRVIGVVQDVRQRLNQEAMPEVYVPYLQQSEHYPGYRWEERQRVSFVLRSRLDRAELVAAVRGAVNGFDPDLPLYDILTVDELRAGQVAPVRVYVSLFSTFAAVALVLAIAGIYSVISYLVSSRRPEIGLRMALGAQPGQILRLVVRQGFSLTLLGAVIGFAGALGVSRFFESLLFEIEPTDPATFGAVVALVLCVGLAASFVPARRAAGVEPAVTLHHE